LYKLKKEEIELYKEFVNMLSNFDSYDMSKIVEDAFYDAQNINMLGQFGGIQKC